MTLRQVAVLALAVTALGACRRTPPPETPAPVAVEDAGARAREQARTDSIAAARAQQESAERARVAALARVQEELTDVIFFEYDSDQLTSEAEARLRSKAAIMRANAGVQVRVEGHADERGSTEYNLALAQRRAETVRNFLSGYGIETGRLGTLSYGKERPLVEGTGEAAWARNRRAEFVVTGGSISTIPPEAR
ncbi:peptidoglycan-associated lipoprotein Pal [soil metagenome]